MKLQYCTILASIGLATYLFFMLISISSGCLSDYEVDHLKIAISWAPGACKTMRTTCKQGYRRAFTIHGMWPQSRGSTPHNCCTRKRYEADELRHLTRELSYYWPSLTEYPDYSFWQYEWGKHGTCATRLAGISSTKQYFQFTVSQFRRFDIQAGLSQYGIYPSANNQYKGYQIERAISAMHGARVNIQCSPSGNNHHVEYLTGIYLCYSTYLQPMDCPRGTQRRCLQDIMFIN